MITTDTRTLVYIIAKTSTTVNMKKIIGIERDKEKVIRQSHPSLCLMVWWPVTHIWIEADCAQPISVQAASWVS